MDGVGVMVICYQYILVTLAECNLGTFKNQGKAYDQHMKRYSRQNQIQNKINFPPSMQSEDTNIVFRKTVHLTVNIYMD